MNQRIHKLIKELTTEYSPTLIKFRIYKLNWLAEIYFTGNQNDKEKIYVEIRKEIFNLLNIISNNRNASNEFILIFSE
jgi:hypothetical protein